MVLRHLRREFIVRSTLCDDPAAGGMLVLVRQAVVVDAVSHSSKQVAAGRARVLRVRWAEGGVLHCGGVHNLGCERMPCSGWRARRRMRERRRLRAWAASAHWRWRVGTSRRPAGHLAISRRRRHAAVADSRQRLDSISAIRRRAASAATRIAPLTSSQGFTAEVSMPALAMATYAGTYLE